MTSRVTVRDNLVMEIADDGMPIRSVVAEGPADALNIAERWRAQAAAGKTK